MPVQVFVNLYVFYGLFLILCGLTAVLFIGLKAKTALVSGGISGLLSWLVAYLYFQQHTLAMPLGIGLSILLFMVFSWRCTLTLFKVFELQRTSPTEVNAKIIAFLLIGLMAVVSLNVFIVRFVF